MMGTATRQTPLAVDSRLLRDPATWIWLGLFAAAGALAVGVDDGVYEPINAALWLALGVTVAIVQHRRRGAAHGTAQRRLIRGAVAGAILGVLLFIACAVAWGVVQIVLGGRTGPLPQYGLGMAVGAGFGLLMLWLGRPRIARWRERLRIGAIVVILIAVGIGAAGYFTLTGPADLDQYPPAAASPYKLPWQAGVRRLCTQSNRGIVTHRGWDEFAYDFAMPVGTDVCAARAGIVAQVEVANDGNGYGAPGNQITIKHDDHTFACYAHIKQDGSYVTVGQHVQQGQRIAASGNVGHSLAPHLHFDVTNARGRTMAITFADIPGDGIPRMGWRYTSGNTGAP
jgi:hypothetical protein